MADLYASRAPVRLNDGTADANNAAIQNSAPAGTEYALVVRAIMPTSTAVDTELPAAALLADNAATPTAPAVGAFGMVYDGSTWDFLRGTAADGALVNLGGNNDVTVTGTVTADTELPTAASIAADAQGPPTAPGVYGWLMGYNGTNWDRVRTANTGRLQVDVVTGGGSNASVFVDNAGFTPDTSSATVIAGLFDDVAGSALTENDVAAARIDSKRALVFVGEDATTRSQKWAISAAGALASNLTQVLGAAVSATNPLPMRPTNGTSFLANLGEAAASGQFVRLTNGTLTASLLDLTNSDPLTVAIVDGAGTQITSFGGGTQYVGDAAATATPTGTIAMGLANAAAPADVSANADAVAQWMLRNGAAVTNLASGGTLITIGGKTAANSLPVVLPTDGYGSGATAPMHVVLGTGGAAYTLFGQAIGSAPFTRVTDGTTTAGVIVATTALKTDLSSVAGTATVTGGVAGSQGIGGVVALDAPAASINPVLVGSYASAAAPADVSADADAVRLWALRNGSQVVNLASGGSLITVGQKAMAASIPIVIASDQGALPVAMAAAGYPSGYNLIGLYGTSAAVAGGATQTAVVTNTPANTKAFYVKSVVVTASGQTKYQVKFGATVLATGFNPQTNLTGEIVFDPPLAGTGDGTTALTIDVTNRETSAMDVYAGLRGYVLV